jgi:hypothetical protein
MPDKEISFDHLKELLLLLCHYPFEDVNKEALSKLILEVRDWNWLVNLINSHGIIALAAHNIREAGLEKDIRGDALARLDNGWKQSLLRNTWLTERWKEVNAILTKAGIKHVLLKGMALEHTVYGSKGLRQMNDNDILVKREDSIKAWNLLQEKGFAHELIKSSLHKRILYDIGKHLPCLYKNGYAIELHNKLYDNYLSDENSFYDPIDNAVGITIEGTKAWILPKDIQIKHLIDHFKKHALGGEMPLRLYVDIAMLDKTTKIEIPDDFIRDPQQNYKVKYLKTAYKDGVNSIPLKYRWKYIIGDIFPDLKWMKKRYNCHTLKAVLHYPIRIGKLLWLI